MEKAPYIPSAKKVKDAMGLASLNGDYNSSGPTKEAAQHMRKFIIACIKNDKTELRRLTACR